MSEKKEDWKTEIKQIVSQTMDEKLKDIQKTALPSSKAEEKPHKHWKAEDLSADCPECKAELEKIGKGYMKKTLSERKDLEYECKECGLGVGKEEEECPSCGSKEARAK